MLDNLHFDAQKKLQSGINKVAKAVSATLGTGGSNVVIEAIENPGYMATNDGYSVANSIVLADPIEDMGRKILLESINRANKASGDGSSTTCVLTASVIEEGLKHTTEAHPMDIKRSIEDCLKDIEKSLEDQTEKDISPERLKQVATISAEDEDIGQRIADIYGQIGPKGIVYWDISKTITDSYSIGTGITVEGASYLSAYMCDADANGTNSNQIRIKNPHILITRQKISSAKDFENIAVALHNKGVKDLVVFADEVDPLIVGDLLLTRAQQGFRIVVLKMPVMWKDFWYEDLPKATGATVIEQIAGLTLNKATTEHLGTVKEIVVNKEDTFLDGIKDVSTHIKALEDEGGDDNELRAARLNTKTARYYVGAQSDSALSYRRLKVEDAIASAFHALNGGIVVGGGIALYNAAQTLPETIGGKILKEALQAPLKTIISNAGGTFTPEFGGTIGFNSRTRKTEDLMKQGIVDPKQVVLNAVKNAISVAATVITAPTIITLPRQEQTHYQPPVTI
jgi:chaperonin GroEL